MSFIVVPALQAEIASFDHNLLRATSTVEKHIPVVPAGASADPTAAPDENEVIEYFDEPDIIYAQAKRMAQLIRSARHLVIYTGAGISTAAKLPDYRGPQGVWTLRAIGAAPTGAVDIEQALPTFAHMAVERLVSRGIAKFIVSTNVDGLHQRSGIPASSLAELHGNVFLERCTLCSAEHLRWFDVRGQHKRAFVHARRTTGRLCEAPGAGVGGFCRGQLRDTIVNFGENLPEDHYHRAHEHSCEADLTLVLGSSMRITPSCELPALCSRTGQGRLCICNLQKTPYDDGASQIALKRSLKHFPEALRNGGVRAFCRTDDFMRLVMKNLDEDVAPFVAPSEAAIAQDFAALIADDAPETPLSKYNVVTMADDGPPPEAVLCQIRSGFRFRRHVETKEKHTPLALLTS